jgi:hypothetical protein
MINDLPEELFFVILRRCSVKDIIIMTCVCKQYGENIDIHNEMKEKCNNKLLYKDLYLEYTYGKSFRNISEIPEDIPFKIPKSNYILLSFDICIATFLNIITVNNDKTYMEYEFHGVLYPDTLNPSNYGYDDNDYYKYRLSRRNICKSLKDLFLCLPSGIQQYLLRL